MKKCARRPPPKCSAANPVAAHRGILAAIVATTFALPSAAAADAGANANVRCTVTAATAEPSQLPRPVNAAPLRYPANEGQDPSTFKAPAAVFEARVIGDDVAAATGELQARTLVPELRRSLRRTLLHRPQTYGLRDRHDVRLLRGARRRVGPGIPHVRRRRRDRRRHCGDNRRASIEVE